MVEQATTVKTSLEFVPGIVAHDPPRSIDDVCLEHVQVGRRRNIRPASVLHSAHRCRLRLSLTTSWGTNHIIGKHTPLEGVGLSMKGSDEF